MSTSNVSYIKATPEEHPPLRILFSPVSTSSLTAGQDSSSATDDNTSSSSVSEVTANLVAKTHPPL